MGSPQSPNEQQYVELERKGMLETISDPHPIKIKSGETNIEFALPRAAVSLIVLQISP